MTYASISGGGDPVAVQADPPGGPGAEDVLLEVGVGGDVGREEVDVVQAADAHAVAGFVLIARQCRAPDTTAYVHV
ncbi:hypothetical protein GCM10010389_53500 [Streptomyces echinoruber]|uniref:Uncharacterized protein n=1 Tax=Streptomyces echinoruber TaxID=68898 RepID=A0A918RP51_9ACTN|nr:hypothetical protein GCM10010389_53500 [Streptomyces echinoruber]